MGWVGETIMKDINLLHPKLRILAQKLLEKAEQALPPIQYVVNVGNLKEIMNAPAEAFSPAFLEEIQGAFTQIANAKPKKEIDLTNSNNYKATKGVA